MPKKITVKADQYLKERVTITDGGCWEWTLSKDRDGYGQCTHDLNKMHNKRFAHQLSYLHYHGVIPDGMVVRHKCRSRSCCNPEHIEIGTQQDNINDMIRDGTKLFGGHTGATNR